MKKSARFPAPAARTGASHHPHMRLANRSIKSADAPMFEIRRSGIHGRGAYATRRIPKGTRIVEYLGDRITHKQADDRYEAKGQDDGHTFLFVVSSRMVIDAGVGGNDARYINHSCDPNCDTVIENERVFIESIRDIQPGEELAYEYGLTWETTDDQDELENYGCRCGAASCRGTMLAEEPLDRKESLKRKLKKKAKAEARPDAGTRSRARTKAETATAARGRRGSRARRGAGSVAARRGPATRSASREKVTPGKSRRR